MLVTKQERQEGIGDVQEIYKDNFVSRRKSPAKTKEHERIIYFGLTGR